MSELNVAQIVQLDSGALVLRPCAGRRIDLREFARTRALPGGAGWVLEPVDEEIEMHEARQILGVPWWTLRRMIDMGPDVVRAWKRSRGKWVLSLESVLALKERRKDPEFWELLRAGERQRNRHLKATSAK